MTNGAAFRGETIERIRQELESTFRRIDSWFERPEELRAFKPSDGGWSIDEVLEHITLTSHFLLIVIRKNAEKALKRASMLKAPISANESDLDLLEPVGQWGSFRWIRPEHMEPAGNVSAANVRLRMQEQRQECLEILSRTGRGEGTLITVRMSVNDAGRLDLYQWIYFLALHARRHLTQMEENEKEYSSRNPFPGGKTDG